MKNETKQKISLNRATLEFAAKLNQGIIETDAELLVAVNPMEQGTTGLGNIKILDLDGVERADVWFTFRFNSDRAVYAISCFNCDVVNVYADPSEFYDVASRIIKGWEG